MYTAIIFEILLALSKVTYNTSPKIGSDVVLTSSYNLMNVNI